MSRKLFADGFEPDLERFKKLYDSFSSPQAADRHFQEAAHSVLSPAHQEKANERRRLAQVASRGAPGGARVNSGGLTIDESRELLERLEAYAYGPQKRCAAEQVRTGKKRSPEFRNLGKKVGKVGKVGASTKK
jgi:hypothetical protein